MLVNKKQVDLQAISQNGRRFDVFEAKSMLNKEFSKDKGLLDVIEGSIHIQNQMYGAD